MFPPDPKKGMVKFSRKGHFQRAATCYRMDKSVPRVTVWHHSAEPRDAKTMTLGTDLFIRTSHSCQILIVLIRPWLIQREMARILRPKN